MGDKSIFFENETALMAFAENFAHSVSAPACLYLEGDLGAGKTTFVRGFLRGLGYKGRVKSPTYTLIEEYPLADNLHCFHLDLYRISEPTAVFSLGLEAYPVQKSIFLIEWPQLGASFLPKATHQLHFEVMDLGRTLSLSC